MSVLMNKFVQGSGAEMISLPGQQRWESKALADAPSHQLSFFIKKRKLASM